MINKPCLCQRAAWHTHSLFPELREALDGVGRGGKGGCPWGTDNKAGKKNAETQTHPHSTTCSFTSRGHPHWPFILQMMAEWSHTGSFWITMPLPSGRIYFLPRPIRKLLPVLDWQNNVGIRVNRELGQRAYLKEVPPLYWASQVAQ